MINLIQKNLNMSFVFLFVLLNLTQQHLRRANDLEHFLSNKAKGMKEEVHRECFRHLTEAYTRDGTTFQICQPVNQYGLSLVEMSLESQLENFNKQNPGFPRMVKLVNAEVNGKKFVLILFYSSYGFQENLDLKLETFKLVVKNYNPKIILEMAKGFVGSYAGTFGETFGFVSKKYQTLSNLNIYKYNIKTKKDGFSKIQKHVREQEEIAKSEGKVFDSQKYIAEQTLIFENKNLFKKADFNIIEKIEFFPKEQQSRFLKQIILTILLFHSNKGYYEKLTPKQFQEEEFPVSKRFTLQEAQTQFAGFETALQLRQPTGFQSFSASLKSLFGGAKVFTWKEFLEVLVNDENNSSDYLDGLLGNILSICADIKQQPVELVTKVEVKKAQEKKEEKKDEKKEQQVKKVKTEKKIQEKKTVQTNKITIEVETDVESDTEQSKNKSALLKAKLQIQQLQFMIFQLQFQ